jgi:uncharacterized repeat protein (TIGR03847 family)
VLIELDPVDRITTDAVGPPGQRTFYIQARKGPRLVTVLVEKQQVQLLAASVVEILSRVGLETGEGPPEEAMGLEEPVVPEWRAGRLSIGYQEQRDMIVLEAEELVPDEEDGDEEEAPADGEEGSGEAWGGGEASTGSLEEELLDLRELRDAEPAWDEPGPPLEGDRPHRVRFWATREQMLSLARHGAAVCERGRPRCQLCGNPIDPEGHHCPALNGQGE